MLVKKLELTTDSDRVLGELNSLLTTVPWPHRNQIGLKYRNGAVDPWRDAEGNLYETKPYSRESDFVNWNIDQSYYVRQEIERLEQECGIKTGRIRFMRMMPKTGLTVHYDAECRYHLVLQTHPHAHFGFKNQPTQTEGFDIPNVGQCYHMPKDNHWYYVDTTKMHWVYNGGDTERIHLVLCEVK